MTMTLEEACAAVTREVEEVGPFEAREFLNLTDPGDLALAQDAGPTEIALATILNAIASGQFIPRTDAKMAVAEMYRRLCDEFYGNLDAIARGSIGADDPILALADADALAEVERIKAERDALLEGQRDYRAQWIKEADRNNVLVGHLPDAVSEKEAAEAEVERMRAERDELKAYRDYGTRMDEKRQAAIMELALGADRLDQVEARQAAEAEVARLRDAAQLGRDYVAAAIEDWGVDDDTSASMKADLAQIDAALIPGKAGDH